MFMQVIQGRVEDPGALQDRCREWAEQLGPSATGWLGSTAGVTADGNGVLIARFDSAESARRNSERPEQGEWWATVEPIFSGPVEFADYDNVSTFRQGGSDDAGFVQVMTNRVSDVARERDITREVLSFPSDAVRPEIIGGIVGIRDDGQMAQAFYFTSEEEARVGEKVDVPEALAKLFEEEQAMTSDLRYLDLTDPWLVSPR